MEGNFKMSEPCVSSFPVEQNRRFLHRCPRWSWVVERTNAWNGWHRRNSKDYERNTKSSTAMIQISNIHLMLNRLSPCDHPTFHYRKNVA